MAFTVKLFTLSKRDNSTKRPTGEGAEYNCIIKTGSGILHPTISLDIGKTNDPSQYNYAYIPNFDRYYFIEEWFFDRALWTASLKVDVLATYKTEIGSSRLYVLRSADASNGNIVDNLYPCKTGATFSSVTKGNPWNTTGCFVVGIVSKNANFGSLNYYAMDSGELASMCQNLLDPSTLITQANSFDEFELSKGLQLSLVDPIQYVKTCVLLPVPKEEITNTTSGSTIAVYRFDTMGTGDLIRTTSRISKSYTFDIPKHPDTSSRGNYVNSSPYTKCTLTIPPFGCIDIDTSVTCNASTLEVDVEIDPTNGKGILVIKCNNIVLNRIESQIGVPISLSSVTRDYVGGVTSAIGGLAGAISGFMGGASGVGAIGGAVAGGVTGIGNAIESLMPRSNTIGTTGAFVANHGDFRLDFQFFRPVNDDNTHNGRPLCEMRTLNTLSGYMLIQDGDVSINGTSTEDSQVRQYLETGFYYE